MAHNSTTYARVTKANGRSTYVPVKAPVRPNSNPKYVAITVNPLGANTRFRGGARV
jgi:hypothetical protein